MKIVNKKKFIVRIIELLVIIATIILTVTAIRGYKAYGGEYLIPIIGLVIILVLEAILEESEENKNQKSNNKRR